MSEKSTQYLCPSCGASLGIDQFDMPSGLATCSACGASHRVSVLASSSAFADKSLAQRVPAGCTKFEQGHDTILRVSTRHPSGWLLAAFSVFWNFGVLNFASDVVPAWVDVIRGASPGASGSPIPIAMLIIMTMMFVPFAGTGLVVIGMALFLLFGRHAIRVDADAVRVHTGVFGIGRTRTFDLASALPVQIVTRIRKKKPGNDTMIQLGSREEATFGVVMADPRRAWTAAALSAAIQSRLPAARPRTTANPTST